MKKNQLRENYLQARKSLSEQDSESMDYEIQQVISTIDFRGIKHIHIFLPIPGKNEINTWPIINWIRKNHPYIILAVPRLLPEQKAFENVILEDNSFLMPNKWMIPEPVLGKTLETSIFDLVFVPLLIADATGHRVGYGKGFYDRFLAMCKPSCVKTGLCYFQPADKIEDAAEHDMRLDSLITPNGIINFNTEVINFQKNFDPPS